MSKIYGHKQTITDIYISPNKLREIANLLEKKMEKTRLGEELPYFVIHLEDKSNDQVIIRYKED